MKQQYFLNLTISIKFSQPANNSVMNVGVWVCMCVLHMLWSINQNGWDQMVLSWSHVMPKLMVQYMVQELGK